MSGPTRQLFLPSIFFLWAEHRTVGARRRGLLSELAVSGLDPTTSGQALVVEARCVDASCGQGGPGGRDRRRALNISDLLFVFYIFFKKKIGETEKEEKGRG